MRFTWADVLLQLLLGQVVLFAPHVHLIGDGRLHLTLLQFPETLVFLVFAGLAVAAMKRGTPQAFPEDGGKAVVVVLARIFFFHGLFSLSLFSLSGLGMVQWAYFCVFLLATLGISVSSKERRTKVPETGKPKRRLPARASEGDRSLPLVPFIVTICGGLFVVRVVVETALPVDLYAGTLQYNERAQTLVFLGFLLAMAALALRAVRKVRLHAGDERRARRQTPLRRSGVPAGSARAVGRALSAVPRTILTVSRLIIGKLGIVFFLIGGVVVVFVVGVLPLMLLVRHVQAWLGELQRFFYDIGELFLTNLTTRRFYQPVSLHNTLFSAVAFLIVFVHAIAYRVPGTSAERRGHTGAGKA